MSSAVLYLAIVAVWGIVLVPMWLRRDGDGISRRLLRRGETERAAFDEPVGDDEMSYEEPDTASPASTASAVAPKPAPRRRTSRGAVIARRRRRTLGCILLAIASAVTVVTGVTPWWFVIPPSVLLVGHLSL